MICTWSSKLISKVSCQRQKVYCIVPGVKGSKGNQKDDGILTPNTPDVKSKGISSTDEVKDTLSQLVSLHS